MNACVESIAMSRMRVAAVHGMEMRLVRRSYDVWIHIIIIVIIIVEWKFCRRAVSFNLM